jgi:hypothetical protein
VRRVVVLGGLGFFGAAAVRALRELGVDALVGGRRGAVGVRVDADDAASVRASLVAGDVVLDAAGPFQARTTALVEAAVDAGFDVVDLADAVGYVSRVQALAPRVERGGVRVLTACSSLSAVTAALVSTLGVADPVRVGAFLAPALRDTARPGVAGSLLASVGAPITVLRGGRLARSTGWSQPRRVRFPAPVGVAVARRLESPDAVTLPRAWPTLLDVDFFAAVRPRALDAALATAARFPRLLTAFVAAHRAALPLARRVGSRAGAFGVEVEGASGRRRGLALVAAAGSHVVAVLPAAMAVRDLALGRYAPAGVVPADRHVDPAELLAALAARDVVPVAFSP